MKALYVTRRVGALLGVLLLVAACMPTGRPIAGARGGSADDPFGGGGGVQQERDIELRVVNLNFNDARLYALTGGSRRRLGTVPAKSDATLTIPWEYTDRLRIEIDLVTGSSCVTRELRVDPGEILELQIESVLRSGLCR